MGGHARNTSTVSVASTAGSRIGEVSYSIAPHKSQCQFNLYGVV